jgi:predicted outer membrane repeat protein
LVGTSIVNSTTQTGDGGAVLLLLDSTLRVDDMSTFESNTATVGSGGAISCQKCGSVEFKGGTELQSNIAGRSGGAVHLSSPKTPVKSSGTHFLMNVAAENGGAIDSYDANWTSLGDHFESNVAVTGSGGAFASFVTAVHFDAATACAKNTALQGGGGCLLWEQTWMTLEPLISGMHLMTNNEAAYGAGLATPGASLRASVVASAGSTKRLTRMTTDDNNILAPLSKSRIAGLVRICRPWKVCQGYRSQSDT